MEQSPTSAEAHRGALVGLRAQTDKAMHTRPMRTYHVAVEIDERCDRRLRSDSRLSTTDEGLARQLKQFLPGP